MNVQHVCGWYVVIVVCLLSTSLCQFSYSCFPPWAINQIDGAKVSPYHGKSLLYDFIAGIDAQDQASFYLLRKFQFRRAATYLNSIPGFKASASHIKQRGFDHARIEIADRKTDNSVGFYYNGEREYAVF